MDGREPAAGAARPASPPQATPRPAPRPPAAPGRPGAAGRSADAGPLAHPFQIGGVLIPNRVVAAPMAGLTTSPYRRYLKAHGAGLVITEMVSAHGLHYRNARTEEYLEFQEDERPLAVQLFGDTPEIMARAAEIVLSRPVLPDIIDINMGCPVRKVVKTGAGSAMLADPARAVAVTAAVAAVAGQAGIPVTVKLRSGLRPGDGLALALGPRLEAAGAQSLAFHPRAASEYYRGRADHTLTAALVRRVGVPVMASGDVDGVETALGIVEATGAAAVMVARGAAGDPWLVGALLSGRSAARPPLPVVVADLRALLAGVAAERGPERAVRWMRKLLSWYLRPSGVPASVIEELRVLTDAGALDEALVRLADSPAPPACGNGGRFARPRGRG